MLSSSILRVDKCRYRSVEKFLECYEFEMSHIQSFFPCIPLIESKHQSKWNHICLSKNLVEIVNPKMNQYSGIIIDSSGIKTEVFFHVKVSPILEPRYVCENMYVKHNSHAWLPSLRSYETTEKVNKLTNTAYIDTLCSILMGKLSEKNISPHFGSVYGVYSGITTEYWEDISEDYTMYKEENWFKKLLKNKPNIIRRLESNNLKSCNIDGIEECNLDDYAIDFEENSLDMKYDMENTKTIMLHSNIPLQVVIMEKFDITFDDLLKQGISRSRLPTKYSFVRYIRKSLLMNKLKAWMFQILAGLCCANWAYMFVHNDLHVQNIMGVKTEKKFIYYKDDIDSYKIPTYGYLMKIIDFGRSTYTYNDKIHMGDVFDIDGDAGGQYVKYSKKGKKQVCTPCPAFDLARLSCSFVEDLDDKLWPTIHDLDTYDIGSLLKQWTYDDYGNNLLTIDGFELYINIARHVRKTTPKKQLSNDLFLQYKLMEGSKCLEKIKNSSNDLRIFDLNIILH